MLCLDIISNLILATLKGKVRGKGKGVREKEGIGKGRRGINNNNNFNNNNNLVNLLSAVNGGLVHHIKGALTFLTMMGRDAVGSTRVTSATLHLHVEAATNYTPITV